MSNAKRLAELLFKRASKLNDNSDEELRLCQRAVQLDPDHDLAMNNLAIQHYLRQRRDIAEHWWARAYAIKPDQVEALYNLGYLRLSDGKYEQAIWFFQQALTVDPRFADAHFNWAVALEGLEEDPTEHYRSYLQLGSGEFSKEAMKKIGWRVVK